MPDTVEVFGEGASQVEIVTTDENIVEVLVQGPQGPEPTVAASINYIFDGGGEEIITGLKGSIAVPFPCVIQSWTLVAEPTGSIEIDIWKTSLGDYPPDVGDSITGGAKPAIVAGQTASSSSLGTWDTAIAEGDVISFNVDSVSSVALASISIKVTRT
jgi:hypothetical protein